MRPTGTLLLIGALNMGCASTPSNLPPLSVVDQVDLNRYSGTWYEIARLPFRQQEGCYSTTATYSLRDDGKLTVVNRCRDGSIDGPERMAEGKAWLVDPQEPGKLKVQFFWPFRGDYWILDLAANYEYVVVGTPSRKYLWILSRAPTLDDTVYSRLVAEAAARGFATDLLVRTKHGA